MRSLLSDLSDRSPDLAIVAILANHCHHWQWSPIWCSPFISRISANSTEQWTLIGNQIGSLGVGIPERWLSTGRGKAAKRQMSGTSHVCPTLSSTPGLTHSENSGPELEWSGVGVWVWVRPKAKSGCDFISPYFGSEWALSRALATQFTGDSGLGIGHKKRSRSWAQNWSAFCIQYYWIAIENCFKWRIASILVPSVHSNNNFIWSLDFFVSLAFSCVSQGVVRNKCQSTQWRVYRPVYRFHPFLIELSST